MCNLQIINTKHWVQKEEKDGKTGFELIDNLVLVPTKIMAAGATLWNRSSVRQFYMLFFLVASFPGLITFSRATK
jgi:hypothetical protein